MISNQTGLPILQTREQLLSAGMLVVFFLLCFVAYWNGLDGPFFFDDINSLAPILQMESTPSAVLLTIQRYLLELDRPLAFATFIFNAALHGDNVFYWKLTGLLLHIINGLLLFGFSQLLLAGRQDRYLLSAFIAGIWLLHPLQVSTVLYVVQRMTILSTMFVLMGLVSYTAGRQRQQSGNGGLLPILLSFLLFMPLGALAKENALLFPVFALLLEVFIFHFRSGPNRKRDRVVTGMFLVIVLSGIVMLIFNYNTLILRGYEIRDFTLFERLLTQTRVLIHYLCQLLVPVQSLMGFMHDDIPISRGLFQPATTMMSIIILLVIMVTAWASRGKHRIISLGVFLFFGGHLMESTIIPLELMFEHRNYLPSAGIVIAVVLLLSLLRPRKLAYGSLGVMVIVLSVLTFVMTKSWASMPALYQYMYRVHPESERLRSVQVNILAQQGRFTEAYHMLESLEDQRAEIQKLVVKCIENGKLESGLMDEAAEEISKPVTSDFITSLGELSALGLENRCKFQNSSFVNLVDRALELRVINNFEKHRLMVFKGYHLWDAQRYEEALDAFESAHVHYPNDPLPLLMAVNLSHKTGDSRRALGYLERINRIPDAYTVNFRKDIAQFEQILHDKNTRNTE